MKHCVLLSLLVVFPAPSASVRNQPPAVTAGSPSGEHHVLGDVIEVRFTATDPDGDRLTLRLLEVPWGMTYAPILDADGPATLALRWEFIEEGPQRLIVEVTDDGSPEQSTRLEWDLIVDRASPVQTADVTGDGIPDLIAPASHADVGGVVDAGALYVWEGGASVGAAPLATLSVPGAFTGDALGADHGLGFSAKVESYVRLADVTADGIADVIVAAPGARAGAFLDAGVVYVFEGGAALAGVVAPTATLKRQGGAEDHLTLSTGKGLAVRDISGDGVADVIAWGHNAHRGGVSDAGAISVWFGDQNLGGIVLPDVDLGDPNASPGDHLVFLFRLQSVFFADVTGDGFDDLITGSWSARVQGQSNAGQLYVWAGGPGLAPDPTAILRWSKASAGDSLGRSGIQLGDVTGDGIRDVVSGSPYLDTSAPSSGAALVWAGGPTLMGTIDETAALVIQSTTANDNLTSSGVRLVDLDDDGIVDVLTGTGGYSPGGIQNVGLVAHYSGGPALVGTQLPTTTFHNPSPSAGDFLGGPRAIGDVTGDGLLDVIGSASGEDIPVLNAGAVHVWAGQPGLAGTPAPVATLVSSILSPHDHLGGVRLADLTGDDQLDVLALSSEIDHNGTDNGGAVLWAGGPALTGTPVPTAHLFPPQVHALWMGWQPFFLADLTGDGDLDVLAVEGHFPGRRAQFWAGGSALTGIAPPNRTLWLRKNKWRPRAWEALQIVFGDATGDGVLDAWTWNPAATVGTATEAGEIRFWPGRPKFGGKPISLTTGRTGDRLGEAPQPLYPGARLLDVTGDGRPELVGLAPQADPLLPAATNTGLLQVWFRLGGGLSPRPRSLFVPAASADDQLGG